jgi:hypothetical protein
VLGIKEIHIPSKSLKLLPILGVPSLPSLPFPFIPGLLPANSMVRFGDNGPVGFLRVPCKGSGRFVPSVVELADESDVWDCSNVSMHFLCPVCGRLPMFLGSPLSVALGSLCAGSVEGVAKGMNAGSSSSSSPSSDWFSLFVNRGRRRRRLCAGRGLSESEDVESEDDVEGDVRESASGERVGGSIAVDGGRDFGFGEREWRWRVA